MKIIAPINIALIKYWGKASEDPVRPSTPSISLTLDAFQSETTIAAASTFSFYLNGTSLTGDALEKMHTFYQAFNPHEPVAIHSVNTGPTAAGVASSASGFAALSLGLKTWFQPDLPFSEWVKITAQGSGSATRSLLGGAVMWHENGQISQVPMHHDRYQMAIVLLNPHPKSVSSRARMKESLSHPKFHRWVLRNRRRAEAMIPAMAADDFDQIGRLMEASTLDMHALIALGERLHAYLSPESMTLWQAIIKARETGLKMYVTADAGPNIKVLFRRSDRPSVEAFLKPFHHPVVFSDIRLEGAKICT